MKKTSSNLHIPYVIIMLLALGCIIAALVLFDYNFAVSLAEMWQNNMIALILAGVFVLLNLVVALTAIILKIKNDELTRDEMKVSFLITVIIIVEVVLCVPIFLIWLVQLIQDGIARRKHENI